MTKCIKCGALLPPLGECPRCQRAGAASPAATPAILHKDLQMGRRVPDSPNGRPPPLPKQRNLPLTDPNFARSAPQALEARGGPVPRRATSEIPVPELPGSSAGLPAFEKPAELTIDIEEAVGLRQREIHASVASLWRRVLAWIVDGGAIAGVVALYLWAASAIIGFRDVPSQLSGIDRLVARAQALQPILIPGLVLALVLALAYSAAFAVLLDGRTFGRLMAGIRLVDGSGLPPSPTRAVIRALLSIVSFCLFLGGFWLALFDARGQTLHDKLTSTFVVRPT